MKKSTILLLLPLLILIFNSGTYSQSGNFTDFLPLQVGNVWVYHCSAFNVSPPCLCSRYIRIKITGTNVINGKTYYQSQISTYTEPSCYGSCNNIGPLPFDSLLRVDSVSGKVFKYAPGSGCITPNELLLDSFKARLHDTIWTYCQPPLWYSTYVCYDTSNVTIFGTSRQARLYYILGFEGGWSRKYVKGIGVSQSNLYNLWCPNQTSLTGCVIDGIVYGDTGFVVGINNISSETPEQFSLSQNYPNPFNPATKIKFAVPPSPKGEGLGVRVIIYDALGREVQTLVNEQLQPGTYEVDWPASSGDASNFSSGIYYYTLSSGDLFITKKMVLLR